MLNPSTHVFPVFVHSSEVDETAKCGISLVDDHIWIWSLLLQYTCTRGEKLFESAPISGTFIGSADSEPSTIQRLFRARVTATYKNFNCKPGRMSGETNLCSRWHTSIQMLAWCVSSKVGTSERLPRLETPLSTKRHWAEVAVESSKKLYNRTLVSSATV